MIYSYEEIKAVHLEITERCNAACPMCPRFERISGELAPFITKATLTLSELVKMFPPEFVAQLRQFNFCGNYGDPIVARDLIPFIVYLKTINKRMHILVNSNASARSAKWWAKLGEILGPHDSVYFGIDGLEDTNHIYRRNTDWNIIMRNVKAYIGAGGRAFWNYIVFEHNEHQIDEAKALAKELGFVQFNTKLTGRFRHDQSFPVIVKGQHIYDLKPSHEERHLRPANPFTREETGPDVKAIINDLKRRGIITENQPKPESKPKSEHPKVMPPIDCLAAKEKCIYVSARGWVTPCCWTAGAVNTDNLGVDISQIDGKTKSIKEIVEGPFFRMVEDSWQDGKIRACFKYCSKVEENPDMLETGSRKYGPDYVRIEPLIG